ncbi:MAG: hypothetical protein DI543_16420 [Bradyrhizobium icense]|nr:MAG: hypothetical protein DI543_16420 [Bradyrhizobium icense]
MRINGSQKRPRQVSACAEPTWSRMIHGSGRKRDPGHLGAPGLTSAEAAQRLAQFGLNSIPEKAEPRWLAFLAKFWSPIPWLLEARWSSRSGAAEKSRVQRSPGSSSSMRRLALRRKAAQVARWRRSKSGWLPPRSRCATANGPEFRRSIWCQATSCRWRSAPWCPQMLGLRPDLRWSTSRC